jgi:hypothetical protein
VQGTLLAIVVLVVSSGSPAHCELWLPASEVYLTGSHPGGVVPLTEPGTRYLSYAFSEPVTGHLEFLYGYSTGELEFPTVHVAADGYNLYRGGTDIYAGGASGSLKYYFALDSPLCIYDVPVPVVFASLMKVRTRNKDAETDWSEASVQLRIGLYDITTGRDTWYSDPSGYLGATSYPGATGGIEESRLFVARRDYLPLQIGVVRMTATAQLLYPYNSTYGGGFAHAYIDPLIQVDPDFMVEVNGQMIPGSEAFPIVFSEGIRQVPEPTAALLAGVACVLLCCRRRFLSKTYG